MRTILSQLSPPIETSWFEWTYQDREGRIVRYMAGTGSLTEHERKRECGGCSFCLGEVGFARDGKTLFGCSHPKFRSWPCEPCKECAPKIQRLENIDEAIRVLEKERRELV